MFDFPPIEHHWQKPAEIQSVAAILTDIEGTTTSISFVHDVLFPYAKANVVSYVLAHQSELGSIIEEVRQIINTPDAPLDQVIATFTAWMDEDKKITPLKTLQGMMWEEGYRKGDFEGHVYEDAYQRITHWHGCGLPIYIYSSGSVPGPKTHFRLFVLWRYDSTSQWIFRYQDRSEKRKSFLCSNCREDRLYARISAISIGFS